LFAQQRNLTEQQAQALVNGLFDNVRKKMSNLSYPAIQLNGLGIFSVREAPLRKQYRKAMELIQKHPKPKGLVYHHVQKAKDDAGILGSCIEQINQERKRASAIKEKKKSYEQRKSDTDLG
jgi:nucleoid DNA-binding protein